MIKVTALVRDYLINIEYMILSEVLRYIIVGCVNTVVGYGVFFMVFRWLHFGPEVANAMGYIIALVLAFVLNRLFVFEGAHISISVAIRFVVAFMVAFVLNQAVLILLVRIYSILPEIAQLFAMFMYTVIFYLLSKYFVFVARRGDS